MSTHGCCLISSNPTGWHCTICLLTAAVSSPPTLQDGTTLCLYTVIFTFFMSFVLSYVVSIVVSIFQINAKKILKAFLYCYCIDSWIPHVVDPSLSLSQIPVLSALVLTQPETDRAVHLPLSPYSVPILNVVKATLAWTELEGLPQPEKKHRCVTCIGYSCETV